jgi:WD40 repeat protein
LFFGRERLVDELVGRLKESRAAFITGPSGSGKSSLVRAGLIPALKRGAIKDLQSERWLYASMKPGRDPMEALANTFSRLKSPDLGDYFRQHHEEANIIHVCAESALTDRQDQRLVFFIDQFEEVFTQWNKKKTEAFTRLLTHATTIENGRVIILFAMRSDFVSNCATYPELNALLNQQFVQIGTMQPDELVNAIAQPALRVGLHIDPDLVAQIINDMDGEPGVLPLMQFALKDLFDVELAKGGLIALTRKAYIARGGIHKSLERHADASFAKLEIQEQVLARAVFSRLIEIGHGTQDTRRTALFEELVPSSANAEDVEVIIRKLADARLVTTDEQTGRVMVTISHERLIDAWPWLKKLVNENRDVIDLQNEIAGDAREWDDNNRDASYLYRGARLANAREKLDSQKIVLSELAQLFIEAGAKSFADELETAKQRAIQLRRRSLYLAAALALTLIAVGVAIFLGVQAREQAKIALARQLGTQAQSTFSTGNSNQYVAALLAVQSTKLFPNSDAAQVLQNNTLARSIAQVNQEYVQNSITFTSDGKYLLSYGEYSLDAWETATGDELALIKNDGYHRRLLSLTAISPDGKYLVATDGDGVAYLWDFTADHEIELTKSYGHIISGSFSPDSKSLVMGTSSGTILALEVATGSEIMRMKVDDPAIDAFGVHNVGFSHDGKFIVSGSYYTIRIWEVATGEELTHMSHDNYVTQIAFSPDDYFVVSGDLDRTVRVWETATGNEIAQMKHNSDLNSVAFSPDGNYILSSDKFAVRIWGATTGQEILRVTDESSSVTGEKPDYRVAFSPDGKYLIVGGCSDFDDINCSKNTARVLKVATGDEIAHLTHDSNVTAVAFSPDGKYVVSGSGDQTARVWETTTGNEVARMTHDSGVTFVAFSPDGWHVISRSIDHSVRVWEATTHNEIAQMSNGGGPASVIFSPKGDYILSRGDDGAMVIWEVATNREVAHMMHPENVRSVAFSPDEQYIVSGGDDHTIRVWETTTGIEVMHMTHDGAVLSVSFSPDGKSIVSGSLDNTARVWDSETGKEVSHIVQDGDVLSVAFSPDGKNVIVAGDRDSSLREATTGNEITRIPGTDSLEGLSPGGKYIVFAIYRSNYKILRVLEAATGKEIARMPHEERISAIAFSPDNKYMTTGSDDQIVHVWMIKTGKEIARMTHDGMVRSLAFSPNGQYVASGSDDNTARVWEATTGNEIARMTEKGHIVSVAISPNNKYVALANANGTIRVWNYQPEDLISLTCVRATRNLTRAEWNRYIGSTLRYQAVCPELPVEPKPSAILVNSIFDYYNLILLWTAIVYLTSGWIAYRAIFSQTRSKSLSDNPAFTWKRTAIASGQGGLLITLIASLWILAYNNSFTYLVSPIIYLLFIPAGLWSGGAYSHFTRLKSGKWSRTKRIVVGSMAGCIGPFLLITLMLTVLGLLFIPALDPNENWPEILIISGLFGPIGGVLSAFGAVIYIFGLQRWAVKSKSSNE